jgi:hypothetical protein
MSGSLPTDNPQPDSELCCYQLDPMQDQRWSDLVGRHSRASAFHTIGWLKSLRQTYGYEPLVITTCPPSAELKNGMVFCHVNSWLTGRRLVSLPFSDHCEPLCDTDEELNALTRYAQSLLEPLKCKYQEIRPIEWNFSQIGDGIKFQPSASYFLHRIDLHPRPDEIFGGFHKDSIQRRVKRAERAGLVEKCGKSEDLLHDFYSLFVMTRGRHRVPPIPVSWFRNLIECLNDALEIRLAYKEGIPIAGILTLRFRDVAYYKYGGSNAQFNNLGATPWLLWKAIEAAKIKGAKAFDMGRTQDDGGGLLAFKNHWVQPKSLTYWRFPFTQPLASGDGWKMKTAQRVFSYMPDRLLTMIGSLVYRHIG